MNTTAKVTANTTKKANSKSTAKTAKVTNLSKTPTVDKIEEVKEEATKKNIRTLLPSLKLDSSLFVTKSRQGALGHDSMYKESLFKGLDDRSKAAQKRQLRKNLEKFIVSFDSYKKSDDAKMLKALKEYFKEYYALHYKVNDYSVESLAGGNVKSEKKARLTEMIATIKSIK